MTSRARITVRGIVQGVGFRPFIYRLAKEHGLNGWVLNSSEGVIIEVEGEALDGFASDIAARAPSLAHVEQVQVVSLPPVGYDSFVIQPSQEETEIVALVPPDISLCPDCQRELFDPADRRYRYPFINCTNCGPRFTIIEGVPYDRPKTTMRSFPMCPDCEREYHDPLDRRFHAQPNACPICGPQVWLELNPQADAAPVLLEAIDPKGDAIEQARRLLSRGAIVAIRGIGGFHLACDATNDEAVARLRQRKGRQEKPFALMSWDLETVERYCLVSEEERMLLESPQRPIVLLRRRPDSPIAPSVAPGNQFLGVMLPYTPLHYLLLEPGRPNPPAPFSPVRGTTPTREGGDALPLPCGERESEDSPLQHGKGTRDKSIPLALVMTSGNYSEEPIAKDNDEARERLGPLADAFLFHNRDIYQRCDDSVARVFEGKEMLLRRSRGYVPQPVVLKAELRPVLACGGELKNTFCLTKGHYAFLSHHVGDLENLETLASYEQGIESFLRFFDVRPEIVAHDLHPDYLSTKYALEWRAEAKAKGERLLFAPVQHHHAHMASCMAENGLALEEEVIGLSLDGTGYGTDSRIWGGEILVGGYRSFERAAHLKYVRLPGGAAAIKRPYRMALSYLLDAEIEGPATFYETIGSAEREIVERQVRQGLNSPWTSSLGRLFDGVSALTGVRGIVTYEGQAAIELEMLAAEVDEAYHWPLPTEGSPLVLDPAPVVRAVVSDLKAGVDRPLIAARFHGAVAEVLFQVCRKVRQRTGLHKVALSGGVFQNRYLLTRVLRRLRREGFEPLLHHQVPANDGGLALGQAAVANARYLAGEL